MKIVFSGIYTTYALHPLYQLASIYSIEVTTLKTTENP